MELFDIISITSATLGITLFWFWEDPLVADLLFTLYAHDT